MVWVMATFIAYGGDILDNPSVNSNSSAGQDGAGQITVSGGTQIFPDEYIIEFEVDTIGDDGEFTSETDFIGITVYASEEDYINGNVLYSYEPQNDGQVANVQSSADGIGDEYVRFNANVLVSDDEDAPTLTNLLVAPGYDIANADSTTFDHHSDVDYDGDGEIDESSTEDGNGWFNINNSETVDSDDEDNDDDQDDDDECNDSSESSSNSGGRGGGRGGGSSNSEGHGQNNTVCFAQGTQIQTERGSVPVEDLRFDDRILTADAGYQPLLWIGRTDLDHASLVNNVRLRPVMLPKDSFGGIEDLVVSRQHLILGGDDRLYRAKDLISKPGLGVRLKNGVKEITYYHVLLERHHLIQANGLWSESFYPGTHALRALTPAARAELAHILPWTSVPSWYDPQSPQANYGPTVRPVARAKDPFTPCPPANKATSAA